MRIIFGSAMTRGVLTMAAPALLPAILLAASPVYSMAQGKTDAAVHGKVVNPGGQPVKAGDVKFSTDKTTPEAKRIYRYTFPIDADGTYKATGVAPGDYLVVIYSEGKSIDFQNVVLKLNDDKTLDFDMTREEYLKAMSPEDRAKLEEVKKKNASAVAENSKIANINATLKQAKIDEKNGKADEVVKNLSALMEQRPNEPILAAALAEAQLASADDATKAARAAKTPTTDPAIVQKYNDAIESYKKAIALNAASKKPIVEVTSSSYLNMGQALGKSGKTQESIAAYEEAVKANPAAAGTAYFNEAATLYNVQKLDEAAVAADKATVADPKRADAYYIKAASLVGKATEDPKTHKFVLPPGCLEAYQQYLELDPTGIHAGEVKELLTQLGQPVKNSFRAGKK